MKSTLRTLSRYRRLLTVLLISSSAMWRPLFGDTAVLYDALNSETSGADYVFADGPLYVSFSTGASPVTLSDVMAKLTAAQGAASGSMTVGLYSDAGTRPGSLLV